MNIIASVIAYLASISKIPPSILMFISACKVCFFDLILRLYLYANISKEIYDVIAYDLMHSHPIELIMFEKTVEMTSTKNARPTLGYHSLFKSSYSPLKNSSPPIGKPSEIDFTKPILWKFAFINRRSIAILIKIAMKSFWKIDSVS